jgi:Pentapeptide repeats (8 copies)
LALRLCSVEVSKEGDLADPEDLKRLLAGEKDQVRADLSEVDVSGRNLAGFDFQWAQLVGAVGVKTNFSGCNFRRANLFGLNGTAADFQNASFPSMLTRVNFEQANLRGASLKECAIRETNFKGADIRGTSFADASIESTDFSDAVVDDSTDFSGAYVARSFAAQEIFKGYSYEQGRLIRKSEAALFPGPVPSTSGGGVAGTGVAGEIKPMVTSRASSGAFDPAAFDRRTFDTAPPLDPGAVPQTIEAIQRALVARPLPIRDAARALAGALKRQAVELQHVKPNEASKLEEYEGLIKFINETSDGLQSLADTIDSAIQATPQGSSEPVLLGKAAEIANGVHARAMEWLLANSATVFDGAFRLGLFGLGMAFVSALGIELSPAVTASIAALAGTVGKGKPPDPK